MRAQKALYEDLKENKAGYFAARVAKRLITDCYGRGVVRGAVEIANLILNSGHPDPTKAESIKTADVTPITLRYPLQLLLAVQAGKPWPAEPRRTQVDKRSYTCRALQDCPPWTLYGGRGANAQVHMLSAYEFWRHYRLKQAKHPYTSNLQKHHLDPDKYHAELTEEGLEKVQRGSRALAAGVDYVIREEGGSHWAPLGAGRSAKAYRHDWVVAKKKRPSVPVVQGAGASKTREEQAMRILVLFFPWVNDAQEATPQVPFVGDFWQPRMTDWCQALREHAGRVGFPTQEVKTLVLNFVFTYCLPRELQLVDGLAENSDNEGLVDELQDLELDEDELLEATATHVRGGAAEEEDALETKGEGDDLPGASSTKLHDLTVHMLGLSASVWHSARDSGNPEAAERRRAMEAAAGNIVDHERALQAGRAGLKKRKESSGGGLVGGGDEQMGDVEAGIRSSGRLDLSVSSI